MFFRGREDLRYFVSLEKEDDVPGTGLFTVGCDIVQWRLFVNIARCCSTGLYDGQSRISVISREDNEPLFSYSVFWLSGNVACNVLEVAFALGGGSSQVTPQQGVSGRRLSVVR